MKSYDDRQAGAERHACIGCHAVRDVTARFPYCTTCQHTKTCRIEVLTVADMWISPGEHVPQALSWARIFVASFLATQKDSEWRGVRLLDEHGHVFYSVRHGQTI